MDSYVFAMFVSPHAESSVWVQYEASVAAMEKIKRSTLKIVAIPIKGATYKNAPEWMHKYFATDENYTIRDIARLLKQLYEEALRSAGELPSELCEGREDIENQIVRHLRTAPTLTGIAINVLVLYGIQNMGRSTLARHLLPRLFPGLRSTYPIVDLSRQADAFDFYLALRNDAEGELSQARLDELVAAWPKDDFKAMAKIIQANLNHYERINQPIILRCARGIRDFGPNSGVKPWIEELFNLLLTTPNIRIVWISEIAIPTRDISRFKNVAQFEVGEISTDAMFVLLSGLLGAREGLPLPLEEISRKINGHPGTAHWVAETIKLGRRSPEAITADPMFIAAYQQQFVEELLEKRNLTDDEFTILQILSVLPALDFDAITFSLTSLSSAEVAFILDRLVETGLISYSMNLGYKVPEIVRSVFLLKHSAINSALLTRVANVLGERIKKDAFTISTANCLIFAHVLLGDQIPPAFRSILTGATLHDLVYEQYQIGMRFERGFKTHLESAAKLAELVEFVPMSNDTFETIGFYGADALTRIGGDPFKLVDKLDRRGLGAAEYIKGSYAYHRDRDVPTAIKHLRVALSRGAFTGRTARLLAKLYYESGDTTRALEVFKTLGDDRVMRDSGLLAQKIRCLRVAGRHTEADDLMKTLERMPDDFADYEMMQAAKELRSNNFTDALDAVQRAKLKPKVDRVNVTLLEAAIKIESGDDSGLDEACNLALGVGRSDDALCLRARAALRRQGSWVEAEQHLRKIQKPNFFDKVVLLRTLLLKTDDLAVRADPTKKKAIDDEIGKLTLDTKATVEEFDR